MLLKTKFCLVTETMNKHLTKYDGLSKKTSVASLVLLTISLT